MPPKTMFGDSFADQALGGQAAFAGVGERSAHHDATPSMVFATVVAVNYARHTIDCVGIGSFLNNRFNNVPVLSSSFTSKDGTTNLPVIKRPDGTTDLEATNPGNELDAIAALVFAQNDPTKPVCIGFLYPKEKGEVLFAEEGLSIDRHNSNVYERLDNKGNWEFVFPDSTYMKIARTDELTSITNLAAKNANNARRKWQIDYDHDRMIVLSHAFGSQLRLDKNGLGIITARREGATDPETGLPISTQNLSWSFNSDGSIVSNFTSLSWTTPNGSTYNIDKDGNIVTNMSLTVNNSFTVTGTTNLPFETYVDGKRIDLLISEIAKWYTENHHHQYYDKYGEGSTDTRWTDGVEITDTLTISPASGTEAAAGGTAADTGTTGTTGTTGAGSLQLSLGIDPSKILFDQSSSEGTSEFAAHADHIHGLDAPATPASLTVLTPGLAGESSIPARSDHKHELIDVAGLKVPNIFTELNTFQSGIQVASSSLSVASRWMGATEAGAPLTGSYKKGDFIVDVSGSFWICVADGQPGTWVSASGGSGSSVESISYGTATARISRTPLPGTLATVSRSDHVHEIDALYGGISGLPSAITYGATQSIGGSTTKTISRSDHVHSTPALWPPSVHDIAGESHSGTLIIGQFTEGLVTGWAISNGTITPNKLSFDPATQAELDAHANDVTKHGGGTSVPGLVSYSLKGTTTNGTSPVILTSDATGIPTTANMIVIAEKSVWSYNIVITANTFSGVFGGRWNVTGIVKRNEPIATTALAGDPSIESYFDDQIKDVSFSIGVNNTTLGALQISVVGLPSAEITWSAIVTLYGLNSPAALLANQTYDPATQQELDAHANDTIKHGGVSAPGMAAYALKGTTNDGTSPVILTSDSTGVPISTNMIVITPNSVWSYNIVITANSLSGQFGGRWTVTGSVKRNFFVVTTALVGDPSIDSYFDEQIKDVSFSIGVDNTTLGALQISVVGLQATDITWSAIVTLYGLNSPAAVITNGGGGSFGSGGSQTGYGRFTFASGKFVTDGDSQYGMQVLRGVTTTNNSVTLTADGLAATNQNIPIMKNSSSWMFEAKIVGNSGGTASTMWALTGLARRGMSAGSTTVVGILDIKSTSDAALEAVVVSVEADTINGGLAMVVTGVLAKEIHWVAAVQSVEVL